MSLDKPCTMARRTQTLALVAVLVGAAGCFTEPAGTTPDASSSSSTSSGGDASTTAVEDATDDSGESSAASTSDAGDTTEGTTGAIATAQVRAVHAALQVGAVDLYAQGDGVPLVTDLGFGEASAYLSVPADFVVLELRPAGAPAEAPPIYSSPALDLAQASSTTVVAAGVLGSDDEDARFRLLAVDESWGPALAGQARARLVHAGSDAPTFRLQEADDVEDPLDRFEASDAAGFPIATAGQRLTFLEDAQSDPDVLTSFTAPGVSAGDEVLLVAAGRLDRLAREPDGFSLIAVGRDGVLERVRQDPELFVLHGSRDAGTLEACSDGAELAANFDYGELRSTRVSPGSYAVDLFDYPAGCVGAPLSPAPNDTGPLEAGQRYLLLLTGEVSPDAAEAALQVATFRDAFALERDANARVRFVHGASYSQVFVGAVDGGGIPLANVLTDAIGWSVESDQVEVPAGDYVLGIADVLDDPSFPAPPLVTVPYTAAAGARQWAIVAGDPTPEDGDGFLQVMVVDTTVPGWGVVVADVDLPG